MVCTAIVCPYMYMGRYCPKEGKNGEKLTSYFVFVFNLIIRPIKMNGM